MNTIMFTHKGMCLNKYISHLHTCVLYVYNNVFYIYRDVHVIVCMYDCVVQRTI